MVKTAKLALEDGTILTGEGFGAECIKTGELVFSTAMVGYVEALTDPSFKGQILMSTYPLEGNYGVCADWYQSDNIKTEAYVVRQLCHEPSHPKMEMTLDEFMSENGIPGISGIDTRTLTIKIRETGSMKAAVANKDISDEELLELVQSQPSIEEQNLVEKVSVKKPKIISTSDDINVAVIDCGVKKNIIDNLVKRKIGVTLIPPTTTADEILSKDFDGVLISSGPGNPKNVEGIQDTIKKLAEKLPVAGICLGQQILALTYGADIYKMKFGHRGLNQPVQDLATKTVYMTSQNHSFAIDNTSIEGTDLKITQINLNDGTPEAIKHEKLPVFGIQYHPESGPGPNDSKAFFDEFIEMIKENQN